MIMLKPATRLRRRALATAAAVALVLCARGATPAAAGNLCIGMANSNGQVAGIQVDLKWDSACMSPGQGAGGLAQCTADPATGKQVRASVRPGPTLKTILFSMTDTNPIGDGNLFCCSFTPSSSAGNACCSLTMGNILGSNSAGQAIPANDFTLVATMDGQACAASEAGSGGQQQPVRSGLQGGGGGVVAPPPVSGGAPAAVAPQAPAAGAAPAAPAPKAAPAVSGVGGVPVAPGANPPPPEAPAGMDQVQRALEQLRGAPTAPAQATTPQPIATPERTRAAGTPTAKARATEAHGTPTAAANKTPEADKTAQATPQGTPAGTPEATPQATPKAKPKHHKHKDE